MKTETPDTRDYLEKWFDAEDQRHETMRECPECGDYFMGSYCPCRRRDLK